MTVPDDPHESSSRPARSEGDPFDGTPVVDEHTVVRSDELDRAVRAARDEASDEHRADDGSTDGAAADDPSIDDLATVVGSDELGDAIRAARADAPVGRPPSDIADAGVDTSVDDAATMVGSAELDEAIRAARSDAASPSSVSSPPPTPPGPSPSSPSPEPPGSSSPAPTPVPTDTPGAPDVSAGPSDHGGPVGLDQKRRWTPPERLSGRVTVAEDTVLERPSERTSRPLLIAAVAIIVALVVLVVVLATGSGTEAPAPDSVPATGDVPPATSVATNGVDTSEVTPP